MPKLLIFIVAYNAEKFITSVIDRIPNEIWDSPQFETEVLIIDDGSKDNITITAIRHSLKFQNKKIKVFHNPVNQRYGGNQKIGYSYAINENFDYVALLHGDGQYAPEMLPELMKPFFEQNADCVLGSRMLIKENALKGGMPRYKFYGNIILTKLQNWVLGSNLSEFHTGFRLYKVDLLKKLPFQYNSNDFDFDTDILIQVIDSKAKIAEVPIPTHYGDEICHVNGWKYAAQIMASSLLSKIQKWHIYYSPKFDYGLEKNDDRLKFHFTSAYRFIIDSIPKNSSIYDFSNKDILLHEKLLERGCTLAVDSSQKVDFVLLNEVIDKESDPVKILLNLSENFYSPEVKFIITCGNIGFFITRISLLFGRFSYTKRGILSFRNKRLMTFTSLKKLLHEANFEIIKLKALPAPYPLALGLNSYSKFLLKLNLFLIKISKGLFGYQAAIIAKPKTPLNILLNNAIISGEKASESISH